MKGGKRISVWIPTELEKLIESYRGKLGISKSSFYRTAVIHYLENISQSNLLKFTQERET